MSEPGIQYGSTVLIRDSSGLEGHVGFVIRVSETGVADVLLDKEIIWPVRLNMLELVSPPETAAPNRDL